MRESEIIAEAERLLGASTEDTEGYVTRDDIRRAGYTDYAAQKALQALFMAGMLDTKKVLRMTRAGYELQKALQRLFTEGRLETKKVKRMTRAGHYQSFPAYRVKPVPQS